MNDFSTPVLITIWDRPDYLSKLFEVLGRIKPRNLFLFSDMAEPQNIKSCLNIEKSRQIVEDSICWESDVKRRYNNYNEGPARGIFNAISWAFEYTDKLIVLEHDYIPAIPFFDYCEELLEKYATDERIWLISGLNHFSGRYNLNADSYFFSKFASIAGFATWKRAWQNTDLYMKNWETFKIKNYSFSQMDNIISKSIYCLYDNFYKKRIQSNEIFTWDIQFTFNFLSNSGFGIVPSSNLIKMVGDYGINTREASIFHFLDTDEEYQIKKHPDFIQANETYDFYYYKHSLKKRNLFYRVVNRIRKIIRANSIP
ncbi:MAG: hypothetical protein LLG13_18695 [Bacteroidales bacterium]|nr:hypothetical protein [Bacteroidales bacterium]